HAPDAPDRAASSTPTLTAHTSNFLFPRGSVYAFFVIPLKMKRGTCHKACETRQDHTCGGDGGASQGRERHQQRATPWASGLIAVDAFLVGTRHRTAWCSCSKTSAVLRTDLR